MINKMNNYILIGGGLILVGCLTILGDIYLRKDKTHLKQVCTEQTEGIVSDFYEIKIDTREDEGGRIKYTKYFPVFKYEVNNQTYVKQSPVGNKDRKRFKLNQKIMVHYNPDNPDDYFVPKDRAANPGGIPTFIKAGIFFLFGVTCVVVGIKQKFNPNYGTEYKKNLPNMNF
jgi:hypothetical protein